MINHYTPIMPIRRIGYRKTLPELFYSYAPTCPISFVEKSSWQMADACMWVSRSNL